MTGSTLWYIDRAAGLVSLMLLTTTVVMGIIAASRFRSERWPRFARSLLHRNFALLALAFSVVHVFTAVVDSYVPIRVSDALVPFASSYKPFWLALGTIGADLMLAVLLTSAIRRRLGYRAWRSVHLLSYGAWGTAMIHAIAMGSDARSAAWAIAVIAGCLGAFAAAFVQRTDVPSTH